MYALVHILVHKSQIVWESNIKIEKSNFEE